MNKEEKVYLDVEECINPTDEFLKDLGQKILLLLEVSGVMENDEYSLIFKKVNKNEINKIRKSGLL